MKFTDEGLKAIESFLNELLELNNEPIFVPIKLDINSLPDFILKNKDFIKIKSKIESWDIDEEEKEKHIKFNIANMFSDLIELNKNNELIFTQNYIERYIKKPVEASVEMAKFLIELHEKNSLHSVVYIRFVYGNKDNADKFSRLTTEIDAGFGENLPVIVDDTTYRLAKIYKAYLDKINQSGLKKHMDKIGTFVSVLKTLKIADISKVLLDQAKDIEKKMADYEASVARLASKQQINNAQVEKNNESDNDFVTASTESETFQASESTSTIKLEDSSTSTDNELVAHTTSFETLANSNALSHDSENTVITPSTNSSDNTRSPMSSLLRGSLNLGWLAIRGSWNLTANTLSYITSPVTSRLFSSSSSSTDTANEQQAAESETTVPGSTKSVLSVLQPKQNQKEKGKEKAYDDTEDDVDSEQQESVSPVVLLESVAPATQIEKQSEPVPVALVAQDENASSQIVQEQPSNLIQNFSNPQSQINSNSKNFASTNQAITLFDQEKKWENLYNIWRTDTERFLETRSNKTKDIDHVLETAVTSPDSNQKIKDVYNSTSRWLTKEENRPLLQSSRTNEVFRLRETMEVWYVLSNPAKSDAIKTALNNIKGYLEYTNHDSAGTKEMWKLLEQYEPGNDKKEDLTRFIKIRDIADERLAANGLTFFSSLTRSKETQTFYNYLSNSNLILEQSSNAKHNVRDGYSLDDLNNYLAEKNQPANSSVSNRR